MGFSACAAAPEVLSSAAQIAAGLVLNCGSAQGIVGRIEFSVGFIEHDAVSCSRVCRSSDPCAKKRFEARTDAEGEYELPSMAEVDVRPVHDELGS